MKPEKWTTLIVSVVELIVIVVLVIFFVAPAVSVQLRPVTIVPANMSMIAIVIPDSSGITKVQVNTDLGDPRAGSKVRSRISIDQNQVDAPSLQPYIILAGTAASQFETCTGSQTVSTSAAWADLNDQQHAELTNELRAQRFPPGSQNQATFDDQNAQISSELQKGNFTKVQLELEMTQTTTDSGAPREYMNTFTTCSFFSGGFWATNGVDSVLTAPNLLVQYGGKQTGPGNFNYNVSFLNNQDYSVISSDPSPEASSTTKTSSVTWSWPNVHDCYQGDGNDLNAQRNCGSINAVVRSTSLTRTDQQTVFFGGIALGAVIAVSINLLRTIITQIIGALVERRSRKAALKSVAGA